MSRDQILCVIDLFKLFIQASHREYLRIALVLVSGIFYGHVLLTIPCASRVHSKTTRSTWSLFTNDIIQF